MSVFNFSCILVVISSFWLSFFVYSHGQRRGVNIIFSCFAICTGIWGLAGFFFSKVPNNKPDSALYWWQVAYAGSIFIPIFYNHFVTKFLSIKNRPLLVISYTLGIIFLFLNCFFPKIFLGNVRFVYGQFFWHDWFAQKSVTFITFYILLYWILLAYAFLLLILGFLKSFGTKRQQIKYFILGSIIGWLGAHGVFVNVFRINIYPYSNFLIAVYPIVIAYAIVRYRLMDITVAMTRTGIFIAVYSLVLGVPFLLAIGWQERLIRLLDSNWWMVPLATSTLGLFGAGVTPSSLIPFLR